MTIAGFLIGAPARVRRKLDVFRGSPISKAVRGDNLTYLSAEKLSRLEASVAQALSQNVPGAVLEFGVALGGSAILLAKECAPREFHGFDVFGMIPEPSSEKDDQKSKERYQAIAGGQSKGLGGETYYGYRNDLYSDVVAAFARHGVPVDGKRVVLHKGLFEDTWPAMTGIKHVAVAHIDSDWYDPVAFCVAAIYPLLSKGSVLVFDDYHEYGGCRAAVDEFLSKHPDEFTADMGENVTLTRRA